MQKKKKNAKNQKWEWDLRIAKWDLEKKWTGKWIGIPHPSGTLIFVTCHLCVLALNLFVFFQETYDFAYRDNMQKKTKRKFAR